MKPTKSYAHPLTGLDGFNQTIEGQWGLRKIVVQQTETHSEGGSKLPKPITQVTALAVIQNPWIGHGTDCELINSPQRIAARLAKLLSERILAVTGSAGAIQAFGKGAIIGESGELEHGAAIIHTPYFASNLRSVFEGDAVISFADTRGPAGEILVVPLCEKRTGVVRDYYQTVRVSIPDAPRPEEIVLVAAASTGQRPFPRVGDRTTDRLIDTSLMNGATE